VHPIVPKGGDVTSPDPFPVRMPQPRKRAKLVVMNDSVWTTGRCCLRAVTPVTRTRTGIPRGWARAHRMLTTSQGDEGANPHLWMIAEAARELPVDRIRPKLDEADPANQVALRTPTRPLTTRSSRHSTLRSNPSWSYPPQDSRLVAFSRIYSFTTLARVRYRNRRRGHTRPRSDPSAGEIAGPDHRDQRRGRKADF